MKIKEGFVLTSVADDYIAVPTGATAESFKGIIRLNDTGAVIFRGLQEGLDESQIVKRITDQYDNVDLERARSAVDDIVNKLRESGILED